MKFILNNYKEEFTSVFVANVRVAFGAMAAIREKGYNIPADISIVGFHDFLFNTITYPSLTTVKVPLEKMGEEAAEILLKMTNNKNAKHLHNKKLIKETELIIRDSVKSI